LPDVAAASPEVTTDQLAVQQPSELPPAKIGANVPSLGNSTEVASQDEALLDAPKAGAGEARLTDTSRTAATPSARDGLRQPVRDHSGNAPDLASRIAAGVDVYAVTDSDKTDVLKVAVRGLINYKGLDRYLGVAVEQTWFKPFGQQAVSARRVYLDFANDIGSWNLKGRIGSDGKSVLGSVSLHNQDWSKEFFVEREIIETPKGLDLGIYTTFAGANFYIPAGPENAFTALAGVEKFTGDNTRFHLRGSFIHTLKSELGLGVELRARYYHSTHPAEYDYWSPANHLEVIPILQLSRQDAGWSYRLEAGYGAQHDTGSGWQKARYAHINLTSPEIAKSWRAQADVLYSDNAISQSPNFHQFIGRLSIIKAFR
jgi:hypothetical protein